MIVALPGFFSYLFSSNIDRMGINNRSLVSRNPFIRFGTTKFLYKSTDIIKSSHNNNVISSFISWSLNILPMKFLDTLFQISKR